MIPAGCQARPACRARRVRSARRRAAGLVPDPVQVGADGADADVQLGGDLGVGAAPGDQGDQFPFPGAELLQPGRRGLRRAGGGEHQGVLGRGGQAHRRAAFLRGPGPAGAERLAGGAQGPCPGGARPRAIGVSLVPGQRGPHRDGLGGPPGRGAQVPAAVQAVAAARSSRRSARRSGGPRAGAPRRPRPGPRAGPAITMCGSKHP